MQNNPEQKLTDTQIHRELGKQLARLDLWVEEEVEFPPYTVDWYVRILHAAFEADGDVWHSNRRARQERDTYLLARYGLAVIHLSEKNIGQEFLFLCQTRQVLDRLRVSADDRFDTFRMELSWA